MVIKAENVTVSYKIGNFQNIGLKEYVIRRIKKQYKTQHFTAVNNVSFCLEKGDMLGIIGTNGSGKSTLLKNIAGIMVPTSGRIEVEGQIAALIELSSGFDADLTVKENTYLRGALLGYEKAFIDEMYDEIIEFAELEEFQDFPFRKLSSGMKSKLAFSISCLVNPDILILDEVFAVGDGAFKVKSKKKMMEVIKGGVTTIMVSHQTEEIIRLCNKVLWIEKGEQRAFGENVKQICKRYERFMKRKSIRAEKKKTKKKEI